jgi:hypothetical protein
VKRSVRSVLPFSSGRRILRFSGKARSASQGEGSGVRGAKDEDELYRALGRIAANWSLIEIASGHVLMGLVGNSDETLARAVVAGQRVENVWETIEALLSSRGDNCAEELAVFRAWRRGANRYRRRRNEAIHSAWSLASTSGHPAAWDVMSQKAKRGARADLFPGGVPELEELARDIAACEDRLIEFHADVIVLMDPLKDQKDPGTTSGRTDRTASLPS